MKCDYYGCKNEATKEFKIKKNIPNDDSYDFIMHVCDKCYDEYSQVWEEQ